MAGSILWAAYRRSRTKAVTMPPEDARKLLGVGPTRASPRSASAQRLIVKVHPDTGGSESSPTASMLPATR
jgi:hypothetical protein